MKLTVPQTYSKELKGRGADQPLTAPPPFTPAIMTTTATTTQGPCNNSQKVKINIAVSTKRKLLQGQENNNHRKNKLPDVGRRARLRFKPNSDERCTCTTSM